MKMNIKAKCTCIFYDFNKTRTKSPKIKNAFTQSAPFLETICLLFSEYSQKLFVPIIVDIVCGLVCIVYCCVLSVNTIVVGLGFSLYLIKVKNFSCYCLML